jgi:uncharacterized protein
MIGPSYLGLVQWAVAPDAGPDLAALAIQVSASQFHGQTFAGGSLSLETAGSWLVLVAAQERRFALLAMARALRRLPTLFSVLPLSDLDELATGAQVRWFRDGLASPHREDAYWVARDFAAGVSRVTAPVQLVGGWYDIFLPWMLEDFRALDAAGRRVQLIIGPWAHTAPESIAVGLREGLGWLRAHLLDDDRLLRAAAVRVRLTGERADGRRRGGRGERGASAWREFQSWPPPGTREHRLWLAEDGRLQDQAPSEEAPAGDRYRYDPTNPTPSVGGPVLLAREPVLDNRALEARADVLTYTTPPLPAALEAIGPVSVELHVRASSPYFDVFARVCDVDLWGASWNVSDGLARIEPTDLPARDDGTWRVAFELWPIGHRFAPGHSVRLQVSSGAHPRYARNPGTGEDPFTTTALRAVDVEVLRGARYPSGLSLPRTDTCT